jgi:hypothetical protein
MTRARILADYVNAGDELALKAPLASPAFTGTPTGITAAHITSGVLPAGVTGGSGLTELSSSVTSSTNFTNATSSQPMYPHLFPTEHVVDSYTKVLIHSNTTHGSTTFTDSSATGHTVTASGDIAHSTTNPRFGSSSMSFDGAGDFFTLASHADFNLGQADFTIDMWVSMTAVNNFCICAIGGYSTGLSWRMREPGGTTKIGVYIATNAHYWDWVPALNRWYHLALVRYGSTLKCYVDGCALNVASGGNPSGQSISQGALKFGAVLAGSTTQDYQGHMDEFRYSKGIARWTSNFTV